jgi:hypothetical protein
MANKFSTVSDLQLELKRLRSELQQLKPAVPVSDKQAGKQWIDSHCLCSNQTPHRRCLGQETVRRGSTAGGEGGRGSAKHGASRVDPPR